MKKVDVQLSILTTLARKQKIANLVLLIVLLSTLWLIQTKIDAQEGFFLQGWGDLVYWIAGILFLLLWIGLSSTDKPRSNKSIVVLHQGVIDTHGNDSDCIRLLRAYTTVTKKLGLDPEKYTLMIRLDEAKNAFATGLNRGKTICVYLGALEQASLDELESILAHEFGHTVNKDLAFSVIRASLGCCISLASGTLGFIIVWIVWGFWSAVLFYFLTSLAIPMISNYASRITETFADSYATIHGFGPGLQSFLVGLDSKKHGLLGSHPHPTVRINHIQKVLDADEGMISDKAERRAWFLLKIVAICLAGAYLVYFQENSLESVLPFLLAGGLFLSADSMLNSTAGSWQTTLRLNKTEKMQPSKLVPALFWMALFLCLFASGIWASYLFMSSTSVALAFVAKVCLIAWLAKPVTSLLGFVNDFFSTASDITTYIALITSLLMMASYFVSL